LPSLGVGGVGDSSASVSMYLEPCMEGANEGEGHCVLNLSEARGGQETGEPGGQRGCPPCNFRQREGQASAASMLCAQSARLGLPQRQRSPLPCAGRSGSSSCRPPRPRPPRRSSICAPGEGEQAVRMTLACQQGGCRAGRLRRRQAPGAWPRLACRPVQSATSQLVGQPPCNSSGRSPGVGHEEGEGGGHLPVEGDAWGGGKAAGGERVSGRAAGTHATRPAVPL
jgi:hypothetical protein